MTFDKSFQNENLSIYLATTDIESTWAKNKSIIFLGTWCLRYSRKDSWQSLNYLIYPYHWDNRLKFAQDYLYVNNVYEKVLIETAKELNKIHGVNYSVKYWRIVIGYWLLYFIQVYFDRWQMLQKVSKDYPHLLMYRILQSKAFNYTLDTENFIWQIQESAWNENLYADIAEKYTKIKVISLNQDTEQGNPKSSIKSSSSTNLSANKMKYMNLRRFLNFLGRWRIFRGMGVAVHLQYLKKFEYLKLSILLRQLPIRNLKTYTKSFTPDQSQRKWTLFFDYGDIFTEAVSNEISRYLPICFLEGYSLLSESTLDMKAVKNPSVIVTDSAFVGDEVWKLWAADNCENGSKLIISQHGGHYGTGAWSSTESHEIAISDRFISWGWKRINERKIVPAPSVKLIGNRNMKTTDSGICLQVTTSLERQSGLLHSFPIASQFECYINDQIKFALSLSNEVRQKLIVRLFPMDFNWDIEKRWNDQAPEVVKDLGGSNINLLMGSARICVATYNATTFLESFTSGVPTVMFWNPNHWELSENAVPYFNMLRQASILFDDPKSCAKHVNLIWNDVQNWWGSPPVQKAVSEFVSQYAYVGTRPIRQLKKALTDW